MVATVANTGRRPGATVVHVYGSVPGSAHERPSKRLVGFAKVRLDAGTTAEVAVPIRRSLLDVRIDGSWLREDLAVHLAVGLDAAGAREI